jgi:ubiquinone/menaquinone biosynthesis C-methylase UbiE
VGGPIERQGIVSSRSPTDHHWDQRAVTVRDDAKVNMPETVQRDLELSFIFKHLWPGARLLEVGCGNGYVTQQLRARVAHIDAFDYSKKMLERALSTYGEKNNRFLHDNVLAPKITGGGYDIALCVRVLINLSNLQQQQTAIRNIGMMLRSGGRLILIEGYRDGFDAINSFRRTIGLAAVTPAAHNCYSYIGDLWPTVTEHFSVVETWHTGIYDFLTRLVYPQLVGVENAMKPGDFHEKIEIIARSYEGDDMVKFARVRGFVLVKN